MGLRGTLGLALVATLFPASLAHASHNGSPEISSVIEADGEGALIANPAGHPISWERCPPGESCTPLAPPTDPQWLPVRGERPGTVWRATQDGVTRTSRPWQGPVAASTPPRASGPTRVGGRVVPVVGTWIGGWGWEGDRLQLQACPSEVLARDRGPFAPRADGRSCVVIYDEKKYGTCFARARSGIPARYAGWWLRVADRRASRDEAMTLEAYSRPEAITPLQASPTVSIAVVGPIARGRDTGPDCGGEEPPVVRLAATARRDTRGRLVLGKVDCTTSCEFDVRIRQGRRTVRAWAGYDPGRHVLRIARSETRRLRGGTMRVTVTETDSGYRAATRRSRLAG